MQRLLILASLALAAQANPLASDSINTAAKPLLSHEEIQHMVMDWLSPQPELGLMTITEEPVTWKPLIPVVSPPSGSAVIQHHEEIDQPELGVMTISQESVASKPLAGPPLFRPAVTEHHEEVSHPGLDLLTISQEPVASKPLDGSLLFRPMIEQHENIRQPGIHFMTISEEPVTSKPIIAAVPPLFSSAVIHQHEEIQPGFSLTTIRKEPVTSITVTSSVPQISSSATINHQYHHGEIGHLGLEPILTHKPVLSSETTVEAMPTHYSAAFSHQHIEMHWSIPQPSLKIRTIREAVEPATTHLNGQVQRRLGNQRLQRRQPPKSSLRALPAHKAHGPRALLPNGPYVSQ